MNLRFGWQVGDVVVAAGKAVATGAVMARDFNEKHRVTDRLIEVWRSVSFRLFDQNGVLTCVISFSS
jgi:hypothetical protein